MILIEGAHFVNKGRNGFMGLEDQFLHPPIPDHKIGGRGVFIQEQDPGAHFQGLHDIGGLGGAAAGVFRAEAGGIL